MLKSVTSTGPYDAVGQTVSYQFVATNTGNVTLTGVGIDDTQTAPAGALTSGPTCVGLATPTASCTAASTTALAPGQSATYVATYTLTLADLNHGSVNDSAIATGTPPTGPVVDSTPSTATVSTTQNPGLTVTKTTTAASYATLGQAIPYTITATNTGTVTLTDVTVTDANATITSCTPALPVATLAPNASITCSATHTVTQADLDATGVTNVATATGDPPSGPPITSNSPPVTIPSVQTSGIAVVKSSTTKSIETVGQVVPYAFRVTNTGNVTLTHVAVTDSQQAPALDSGLSAIHCPTTSLAGGASETCTATYTVTAADLAHGSVADSASVTGTPPIGDPVTSGASPLAIPAASITVVKATTTTSISFVGQSVPFTFTVTNTGFTPLTSVSVADFRGTSPSGTLLAAPTCPSATLAAGASEVCTSTYTVTAADLAAGSVSDTATAQGTAGGGVVVGSDPSTISLPRNPKAPLTVHKTTSTQSVTAIGQVIQYSFLVTNNTDATLTGVTVVDTQAQPSLNSSLSAIACPSSTLAAGASETCMATYTVTAADLANGFVNDTATATGIPPTLPDGSAPTPIVSQPSSAALPVAPTVAPAAPVSAITPTTVSVTG